MLQPGAQMAVDQDLFGEVGKPKRKSKPLTEAQKLKRREIAKTLAATPERKEYMRQWYQANRERVRRETKEKMIADPERFKRYWSRSNFKHKLEDLERSKALYHRDKHQAKKLVCIMFNGARRRARDRDLPFALTKEWILNKVAAGKCELTGIAFVAGTGVFGPFSPSLDRIDNTRGYTPDNCRLILWSVNSMKGESSDEVMFMIARALTERNR